MKRVTVFPYDVQEIENLYIPLPDGTRLAGRLWLPVGAEHQPVPAIFEFIPYRKRDHTALRDAANHGYLAGHGYASIRVDARGVGDSEGRYGDQFSDQYGADAAAVIAWLAAQPWCDGQVAMFGLSWGGAISLQTAALRPPALKAVVCAAGIDDRHALRYPGGCLTTNGLASILYQITYASRPPDPAIVGPSWRDVWQKRLEAVEPMARTWLGHPERDDYWKTASVAENYDAIGCPVMIAAGWNDPAFARSMLRVLAELKVPRKAIIGAWGHRYPHVGLPGPAIGYLQETLRWLDHWLKGKATGVMDEPDLRFWMRESAAISARPDTVPGRWLAEAHWPSPVLDPTRWQVDADGLLSRDASAPTVALDVPNDGLVGAAGGEGMPIFTTGHNPELAGDQRHDDRHSLCLDSAPLEARVAFLGSPVVELALRSDRTRGQVAVRLCEVMPDGRSRRLAFGFVNLATAIDAGTGHPLRPGARIALKVPLSPAADGIDAGNRIRIAISTTYWPMLWPAPEVPTVAVLTDGTALILPVRACADGETVLSMPEPEAAPPMAYREIAPYGYSVAEAVEPGSGRHITTITDDNGTGQIVALDLTIADCGTRRFTIDPADPLSAAMETINNCSFSRGSWSASAETRLRVSATASRFVIEADLVARSGDEIICRRSWREEIDRGPL